MATKYGFIGLGSMGYPMCTNIHAKIPADDQLFIHDVNTAVLDRFVQESKGNAKVTILASAKQITEHCDIIITILPKSEHVQQVYYLGDNNLLSADKSITSSQRRKLFIECSTIDPVVSREAGSKVIESGLGDFADAAVSGGPFGAKAATLSHMIGCPDALFPSVKSVVSMTGTSLFHCGPVGSGVTVKIINNYISICNMLSASEGFNLGMRLGLDPKKLTDIINASSGRSWTTMSNHPVPGVQADSVASRGYKGGFAIELAAGCVDLAMKGAEDVGAKMTLGPSLQGAFHAAMEDERCKGLDARSIFRWVSEMEVGQEGGGGTS